MVIHTRLVEDTFVLNTRLSPSFVLHSRLSSTFALKTKLSLGTVLGDDSLETYKGPYVIAPKINDQNFETKNKKMKDDLTIQEIPIYEVPNPQGGTTLIIE